MNNVGVRDSDPSAVENLSITFDYFNLATNSPLVAGSLPDNIKQLMNEHLFCFCHIIIFCVQTIK